MFKKSMMNFSTINTILNTAPIVIQGTKRLVKLIRARGEDQRHEATTVTTATTVATAETDIENALIRLNQRLDVYDESSLAQIKLIEELAKQNELLALQLKKMATYQYGITLLAIGAMIIAIICFFRIN